MGRVGSGSCQLGVESFVCDLQQNGSHICLMTMIAYFYMEMGQNFNLFPFMKGFFFFFLSHEYNKNKLCVVLKNDGYLLSWLKKEPFFGHASFSARAIIFLTVQTSASPHLGLYSAWCLVQRRELHVLFHKSKCLSCQS